MNNNYCTWVLYTSGHYSCSVCGQIATSGDLKKYNVNVPEDLPMVVLAKNGCQSKPVPVPWPNPTPNIGNYCKWGASPHDPLYHQCTICGQTIGPITLNRYNVTKPEDVPFTYFQSPRVCQPPANLPVSYSPITYTVTSTTNSPSWVTIGPNGLPTMVHGDKMEGGLNSTPPKCNCKHCKRELSSYLDAYWGTNPEGKAHCIDCRKLNRIQ